MPTASRPSIRFLHLLLLPLVAVALGACNSTKEAPRPRAVAPIVRDIPTSLRGTIGAECSVNGIQPTLVSGLGFVVGLNGTGGLALDAGVAATMERELGLRGISKGGNTTGGTAIQNVSPRDLLRDPNTAVVTVYAAIPPGAPQDATFDVYVRALNATSLEGGTLWTTDLRLGEPTTFGGYQTLRLATARGEIFVNPFVDPGTAVTGAGQAVGRVLAGGVVDSPLKIELVLDNESAARARSMVAAINSRFPSGPHGQTARGRSAGSIALTVPPQYTQRSADFLKLVLHLPIDQSNLDAYARSYTRVMKNEPQMAEEMTWCLRAVGERSLPFVRELYEDAELIPRLASLHVGAALGDPRASDHLLRIAHNAPNAQRIEAITLLKTIDAGPMLDLALRELLDEPELTVRVAAYETLAARAESSQLARATSRDRSTAIVSGSPELPPNVTRVLSGSAIQGVDRRVIGEKFVLDRVPGGRPLIYVTQQNAPRVVVFGDDAQIAEGVLASIWSDRLMIMAESPGQDPRIYYHDTRTGRTTQSSVSRSIPDFVEYLGRAPRPNDPRPGLDLSYSEVVGALHSLQAQGAIQAAFATERDKLMAMLLDANRQSLVEERPETASDATETVFFEAPGSQPVVDRPATPAAPPKPIPITPPEPDPKAKSGSKSGR